MLPNTNFIWKRNNRSKNNLLYCKPLETRLMCLYQARPATLNEAFPKYHKKSGRGAINQIASQEMLVVLALTVRDFSSKLLNLCQGCPADIFLILHSSLNSFPSQQGQDGNSTKAHVTGIPLSINPLLSVTSSSDIPFPCVSAPGGSRAAVGTGRLCGKRTGERTGCYS